LYIPNYHETRKGGQGPIQGCSANKEEEEEEVTVIEDKKFHLKMNSHLTVSPT
jgi:hypothetical protein